MRALSILWKFSRPHTIIGSVISIYTLSLMVYGHQGSGSISLLILAICIGISCNIFIVGLNQIADVDIDRINKPYLPIPSGALTIRQAKIIVFVALSISLVLALYVSPYLLCIVTAAVTLGWAYSMPPLYLKKHHLTAALTISTVRGILLNACGFMVFNYLVNHSLEMPKDVMLLTLFIMVFSIAIAWFKDLPDMEGDAKYNIKTFAILYSPKVALVTGHLIVGAAYLFTIYMKYTDFVGEEIPSFPTKVLLYGHMVLFLFFIANAFSIRLDEYRSINRFYMRFWWFFFAEYMLYMLGYGVMW
jgi:homogentisate phytyltransferase/homogentisate geranylgeranyltransferase